MHLQFGGLLVQNQTSPEPSFIFVILEGDLYTIFTESDINSSFLSRFVTFTAMRKLERLRLAISVVRVNLMAIGAHRHHGVSVLRGISQVCLTFSWLFLFCLPRDRGCCKMAAEKFFCTSF